MLFDGENEAELNIETKLIDGFTYRIPFELRFKEDIALSDLQGETVCQCASLQFEATTTRDQSTVAMGNIFLRPQAVDLVQTLRAFGNRSGENRADQRQLQGLLACAIYPIADRSCQPSISCGYD